MASIKSAVTLSRQALPLSSARWMEITPQRCVVSSLTTRERWEEFKVHASQLVFMVRWNVMERAFAKTLGPMWVVFDPITQAALYVFLLVYIFRVNASDVSFTFVMVSITFWRLHANLVTNAPTMFLAKGTVLQQTNFPPRLIVFEFVATESAFFVINLLVTLVIVVGLGVRPTLFWAFVPLILAVQLAFSVALAIFAALVGAVVKDITTVLVFVIGVWFYLSPVVYGVQHIPPALKRWMAFNPFSQIMPAYQAAIFDGKAPSFKGLIVVFVLSAFLVLIGFRLVARARYRLYKFL